MKKILYSLSILAIAFGMTTAASANAETEGGSWQLNAPETLTFTCDGNEYAHTLDTVANGTDGNLTGTGHYNADGNYTWDLNGTIDNDAIAFTVAYTGTNAGYTIHANGTIASDGSITGTTDGNCQTFSMTAGAATLIQDEDQGDHQFQDNHGQYVKSQSDKREAAHSREGMPEQSKGHTQSHDDHAAAHEQSNGHSK